MVHLAVELRSTGQPRAALPIPTLFLDQAGADAAEEIFAVGFGLG
jgi:hypothetical protein